MAQKKPIIDIVFQVIYLTGSDISEYHLKRSIEGMVSFLTLSTADYFVSCLVISITRKPVNPTHNASGFSFILNYCICGGITVG